MLFSVTSFFIKVIYKIFRKYPEFLHLSVGEDQVGINHPSFHVHFVPFCSNHFSGFPVA